jgi:hypothetical protein
MYKNKYIILFFLILILFYYFLINYYNKNLFVYEILQEWNNKTGGGYIKLDDNGKYEGDYYLSINNFEDRDSHIHLMPNLITGKLCYLTKKYDNHSKLHIINISRNPDDIVDEMIKNFYNFKY